MLLEYGILNFWTYLLGAIFIILVPGPNSLFVLATGAKKGISEGYKSALGVVTGDTILMFAAFLGVASLIRTTPLLFSTIKIAGAIYLSYLGVKALCSTLKAPKTTTKTIHIDKTSSFKKALLLSLTNPKAILFLFSFFVQFIDPAYPHPAVPFLIQGIILQCISVTYMSFLIFSGAELAKRFRENQKLTNVANMSIGLLFLGFGMKLITSA